MSNLEIVQSETKNGALTKDNIDALIQAQIIPNNTPVAQIKIFAQICKERGISPFSKEVYLVGYGGKYSVIVGINGFRKIACETGEYAGCDDVKYNLQSTGEFHTAAQLKKAKTLPSTATITVYRLVQGHKVAFTHTAVFSEFSSGKQKWGSMPFQMISKVAEAFALRKGFSDRLTGLNVMEEKEAFEGNTISKNSISDMDIEQIKETVNACETIKELKELYTSDEVLFSSADVIDFFTNKKLDLENG